MAGLPLALTDGAVAWLLCLTAVLATSCSLYRRFHPKLDREVSGPATITSE